MRRRPLYRNRPGPVGDDCLRHPDLPSRRRGRPVGWRNEPGRHALSAKGIRTARRELLIHRPPDYDFEDEWERESRSRGIKTRLGEAGKHLYYFYFGAWHPYQLSTWINKTNRRKRRDYTEEMLSQAGGSPTGAFDLIYAEHKQLISEYYGTDDPNVRKSLEEPIGIAVSAMHMLSPDVMME